MRVTAPAVTIEPGIDERRALRLPALDVEFQMQASCSDTFSATMLSLTIADSRSFLDADDLDASDNIGDIRLTVPADQLAPLILTDYCRHAADEDSPATESAPGSSLTLNAVLSASAALLCRSEDQQQMVYAAAPLDVVLVCESSEAATEAGGE